jgi:excisionase family DNA binding protein
MSKTTEKIMTRKELKEFLRIGNTTVQKLCHDKRFPAHKIGKRFFFLESEVVEYIKTHRTL